MPYLLKGDRRDAVRRQAPLAVGQDHSFFIDKERCLHTCGIDEDGGYPHLLGHAVDPDTDPNVPREIGPPTLVPSMQERRIVCVASSAYHCLALSAEGEVFSWGNGDDGGLGHGDDISRNVPSRIESLSCIEHIAAGPYSKSAAVNVDGSLFTWGQARYTNENDTERLNGLGYEID